MEWIVEAECKEDLVEGCGLIGEELVRCKDCKRYWKNNNDWMITLDCVVSRNDDGFCYWGESKDV